MIHDVPTDRVERAREVADELAGTAQNLSDAATEAEFDDATFLEELDQHVFECDACGWWCRIEEMSDSEGVCDDCYDGGDADD